MKTNAELAPDAVRLVSAGGELETRAAPRPLGPISRRLAERHAADPTAVIVEAINDQTRQLRSIARPARVEAPRRAQPAHERSQRALHELRATAERRDAAARRGRADPLFDQQMARMNAAIDQAHDDEVRQLRARNRELERRAARPMGPSRGYAGARSQRSQVVALYRKAALQYLRHGDESGVNGLSLRALERKVGLNTEMLPQGGVFVHPEHDTSVEKLLQDVVPMRQLATVKSISAGEFKKAVDLGGTKAKWVGEREERPETDGPEVDELSFPAHELYADPIATQTLLEDSLIDIEAWLAESVLDQFALTEGETFIAGDGVKKPFGLLAYPKVADGNWKWGSIGYQVTGVDGGFAAPGAQVNQGDKLWTLIYSLKSGHRQNAKFLMNRGTIGLCRILKDGEGRWIWADARDGNPNSLCGYEVVEGEQMPDVAADSFSIAFGDFAKTYLIVDRVGVSVLRDPYSRKPYIQFYTRKRVGGGIQNFETMKLLKFADQ